LKAGCYFCNGWVPFLTPQATEQQQATGKQQAAGFILPDKWVKICWPSGGCY